MYIIVSVLLNALALILTAYLVPGFHVLDFKVAILAAIVLGVVNTFIRPVLLILTAPLTFLTLGLFAFVVNAIMLWIVSKLVTGVTIDSSWSAIMAAIVLSLVSTAMSMLFRDLAAAKAKRK